ncbi:MAG: glycosyltransferase family 39 protein, partial [Candidatus Omnitrophica bacterium]|nr:glycosyltransferase family 39 protein [Candidatus Omnitrophota bacterium]
MQNTAGSRLAKQDFFFALFIFVSAFILRVFYLKDFLATTIYPVLPYSDSYSYYLWAKDIASGDLLGSSVFMKWPLYAYLLGFIFKITSTNLFVTYLLQFILGSINCVLVYFIAKKLFNRGVAFIAGMICAWYALFIFYEGLLIYTSLSLLLNSLLFLLFLCAQDSLNKKRCFLLGLFSGICALAQANAAVFAFLAMLWILITKKDPWRSRASKFLFFFAGLLIVIGAVTARNYAVGKDLVLISGNPAINFYCGNNQKASGTFECPMNLSLTPDGMFRDSKIIAEAQEGGRLKNSQVSRFWFKKTLEFIRHDPGEFLKLLFRKLLLLFSTKEYNHDLEYYRVVDKIRAFKIMLMDLRFILPFALLGVFLNLKDLKQKALLYIVLLALPLTIIIFFVSTRYKIALVPFLVIFAASGIVNILDAARKKKFITFLLFSLTAILFFVFFNYADIFARTKHSPAAAGASFFNTRYHLEKTMEYIGLSDYQKALQEIKKVY